MRFTASKQQRPGFRLKNLSGSTAKAQKGPWSGERACARCEGKTRCNGGRCAHAVLGRGGVVVAFPHISYGGGRKGTLRGSEGKGRSTGNGRSSAVACRWPARRSWRSGGCTRRAGAGRCGSRASARTWARTRPAAAARRCRACGGPATETARTAASACQTWATAAGATRSRSSGSEVETGSRLRLRWPRRIWVVATRTAWRPANFDVSVAGKIPS